MKLITPKKRIKSFEDRKKSYGRKFILLWEIGFVLFFLVPLAESLWYSLSKVTFDGFETVTQFIGFENYNWAFFKSPNFIDSVLDSFTSYLYSMPFLLSLSLIVALLLNQKFRGRTIMRAIFFIPVIVCTGVIMDFINQDSIALELLSGGQSDTSMYFQGLIDFNEVMSGLGLPDKFQEFIMNLVNSIYQLLWSCGIPIVLFISGLQSIPEQLYEVSKVEGATKWEEFWFITIPMLSSAIILVVVYITIDMLTQSTNPVMMIAITAMQQGIHDTSSAMLWSYFAIMGATLGVILLLFNRICVRKWE